jgi:hypothetical protein
MKGANQKIGKTPQTKKLAGYLMAILRFFTAKVFAAVQSIERGLKLSRYSLVSWTTSS